MASLQDVAIGSGSFHFQIGCPSTVTVHVKGPLGDQTITIPTGKTADMDLKAGPYTVTVTAPGFVTITRYVIVTNRLSTAFSATMYPKSSAPAVPLTDFFVKVLDSKTGQEIPNASVYINGQAGNQTQIAYGTEHAKISARAPGYKPNTRTVDVQPPAEPTLQGLPAGNGAQQIAEISLDLIPVPDTVCAFLNAPRGGEVVESVAGVTVTLNGQTAVTTADVQGTEDFVPLPQLNTLALAIPKPGGWVSFPDVPPGTYTVTATKDGYQPFEQQIDVGATRLFTFQLIATEDGELTPAVSGLKTDVEYTTADIAASLDVAEQTYDNSAYQGYFTSAQCQLYIGDLFIDELVTLQYALQTNRVPVYGYCSQFADAWGRGRSIVQGQIVVNYVHQGYLYAAVAKAKTGAVSDPAEINTLALQIARTTQASINPKLGQMVNDQAKTQLKGLLAKATPDDIQIANSYLRSAKTAGQDPYKVNPLYLEKAFDMRLVIGDGAYQSIRMLEAVELTGDEQIVDARSGEVLAESYSFLARRLR